MRIKSCLIRILILSQLLFKFIAYYGILRKIHKYINQFKLMGGKKWCEYCRININYNKKDIQQHEETRLHLQNKQRTIKFERARLQQQEKQKRELQKSNALLSTANIPKAAKGSQQQRQIQQYKNQVYNQGKAAIHQLIAERTKGRFGAPIQFPDKEDLVLAQNFEDGEERDGSEGESSEELKMWRIDVCEETGEPCFINKVTKAKYYEPPKGYIMSEHQREQWEYLKEICQQKVENADNTVNISDWQQVPEEQDYFNVNKAEDSYQDVESKEKMEREGSYKRPHPDNRDIIENRNEGAKEEQRKSWLQELEQKVNRNELDANDIMETVIQRKLAQCKNLKQKNETLKKLIKGDLQIRQNMTQGIQSHIFQDTQKASVGFKTKKKVKKINLTDYNE